MFISHRHQVRFSAMPDGFRMPRVSIERIIAAAVLIGGLFMVSVSPVQAQHDAPEAHDTPGKHDGHNAHAEPTESRRSQSYKIDPIHTSVSFKIEHMGMSYIFGRFNQYEGNFKLAGNHSAFGMTIDADSIDTNHSKRDDHLRGSDFFNAKQFPKIIFASKKVTVEGDVYQVEGDLTLHGITKLVRIDFYKMADGKSPTGKKRTGFNAEFVIDRTQFGMKHGQDLIGNDVTLAVSFEGEVIHD